MRASDLTVNVSTPTDGEKERRGRGAWKATDLGKEGEIEPKGDVVVFFHSPFPS